MEDNWWAVLIASFVECSSVEQAFELYDTGRVKNYFNNNGVLEPIELTAKDFLEMLRLKERGVKRKEIASKFNISIDKLDYRMKKMRDEGVNSEGP